MPKRPGNYTHASVGRAALHPGVGLQSGLSRCRVRVPGLRGVWTTSAHEAVPRGGAHTLGRGQSRCAMDANAWHKKINQALMLYLLHIRSIENKSFGSLRECTGGSPTVSLRTYHPPHTPEKYTTSHVPPLLRSAIFGVTIRSFRPESIMPATMVTSASIFGVKRPLRELVKPSSFRRSSTDEQGESKSNTRGMFIAPTLFFITSETYTRKGLTTPTTYTHKPTIYNRFFAPLGGCGVGGGDGDGVGGK